MNAVATPPVKPDTPLTPAPAAVHRDGRTPADAPPATSSFMAAMHEVNGGQAPARSSAENADVPRTIAAEDQSSPCCSADGPLDAAVADLSALAPVESQAVVLPADGIQAVTDPAITARLAAGAVEEPVLTAKAAAADEPSTTGPIVGALRGAAHAPPGSEMLAAAPHADARSAGSAAQQAPIHAGHKPSAGVGNDLPFSARTMTTAAEGRTPENVDAIQNPGARMAETAGQPVQRSIAHATAEASPNPSPFGAGKTGPLLEGGEGLPHPLQATDRQTASPGTRLFEATARQATFTSSAAAANTETGPGGGAGKAAAETPELTAPARLTVEGIGARDGSALNGDGKPYEDHHRPWLATEQIAEAKSSERTLRLEVDSRSDGMTAVDRTAPPDGGQNPAVVNAREGADT